MFLDDNSVDSVVTDPPYGLSGHRPEEVVECLRAWLAGEPYQPKGRGFMGAAWDAWVPGPEVWRECLRVLKPGGHMLVFAGTRSMDLMSMAIRLAGFDLRDAIGHAHDGGGAPLAAWLYGSGFPKSLNVSKAIDREAGAEREVVGMRTGAGMSASRPSGAGTFRDDAWVPAGPDLPLTVPATDAARQWDGWGTALKPAFEPIIMARKPLAKGCTVAANVLAHGTGALNIDGCRVGYEDTPNPATNPLYRTQNGYAVKVGSDAGGSSFSVKAAGGEVTANPLGRWPANLIHDGSDEVIAAFPNAPGQMPDESRSAPSAKTSGVYGAMKRQGEPSQDSENDGAVGFKMKPGARRLDAGSAARFFYCAKASKVDREEGLDAFAAIARPNGNKWTDQDYRVASGERPASAESGPRRNTHPTVKPTALMAYLCRLVTPPGGTVLDPFMGSGSTGVAAVREGFAFIGIELDPAYLAIARARIAASGVAP